MNHVSNDENKIEMPAEQTFFDDLAIDRLMGLVMALATEVYVLRDRQRALERLLEKYGSLTRSDLDCEPTQEEVAADAADREAFVTGLLENLLGRQKSKGMAGSGLWNK